MDELNIFKKKCNIEDAYANYGSAEEISYRL